MGGASRSWKTIYDHDHVESPMYHGLLSLGPQSEAECSRRIKKSELNPRREIFARGGPEQRKRRGIER